MMHRAIVLVFIIACHLRIAAVAHGQEDARVYSPEEVRALGRRSLAEMVGKYGRDANPTWRRDVGTVIERIRKGAAYQGEVVWEIVSDSTMNASAAPGGVMVVNVGLPLFCQGYGRMRAPRDAAAAQRTHLACLGAVIGHELAHLALGHTDSVGTMIKRREEIARRMDSVRSLAGAVADSVLMKGLQHERREELEADRAGGLYLLRAGWQMQDAIDLFVATDSMARASAAWHRELTWLSTHPRSAERIAELESYRGRLKLHQRDFDDALALLAQDEMPDSALAMLDRVLRDFPNLAPARHARATVLARTWLATAPVQELRVRPSLPTYDAQFMSAIRGSSAPALVRAREAFRAALAIDPHPYTLSNLAVLDAYAGELATARQRASLAAQRMPDDASVQNNLGVVLFIAGAVADADQAFARAEQASGDAVTPAIAFNVARAAAAAGDTARALGLLGRYLEYDSSSGWGRAALELQTRMSAGRKMEAAGRPVKPSPGATAPPPDVAGVRLGMPAAQVQRALGRPDTEENQAAGVVWRYPSRGLTLLVDPMRGVRVILVDRRDAGQIGGVSVGDGAKETMTRLGAPLDRAAVPGGDAFLFDRGAWTMVVVFADGAVREISARTKDR